MARLGQYTSLTLVKEKDKYHIKIFYSKKEERNVGKSVSKKELKRFTTNVYVKDAKSFKKDKVYKKNNSCYPENYQDDSKRLNEQQHKLEEIIEKYVAEHHEKPSVETLEMLLDGFKKESQRGYEYIQDYLDEYIEDFKKRGRNSKSVVMAFASAYLQFCVYTNKKYTFYDLNSNFFDRFIEYLLFLKPKSSKGKGGVPNHCLSKEVRFDPDFGMNSNTLIKRIEAVTSFIRWAIKEKDVQLNYDKIKAEIRRVMADKQISEYDNVEFAFKSLEEVKMLASKEFEDSITGDYYTEYINKEATLKFVSRDILIRAKDYFIVSCLTGNRISDLREIKEHHVDLKKQRAKKTKSDFILNVNQTVIDLLSKYNFDLKLYDQKYNKCIKVFLKQFYQNFLRKQEMVWVIERRGKYEEVSHVEYFTLASSHSGRRSFATIAYNSGKYQKKTIMNFTGHKSEREFDKYIQLYPKDDVVAMANFMDINNH